MYTEQTFYKAHISYYYLFQGECYFRKALKAPVFEKEQFLNKLCHCAFERLLVE